MSYLNFPYFFNIGNFVFWNHLVDTSAGGTLVPEGIHQPSCQTCLTWNLSNNVLQKFAAFDKILKHWKYGKALKSNALSSGPWRRIWLPVSICLDLSASFAIFEYLTSYVSVLVLLMRGYSLKCTYSIPKFSIFI